MFTRLFIDNFGGISAPIEFDFISKSRNKENLKSVVKIEEGIYVNKLIGIIGGNASGKTSILNAIRMVGTLLISPVLQYDFEKEFEREIEKVKELFESGDETSNTERLMEVFGNIKTAISIEVQNLRRKKEDTKISLEMHIASNDDSLTGFYSYEIIFNGFKRKIKREYLGYRSKYKEPTKTIIEISDTNDSQVYYINRHYKNLSDFDSENKKELDYKYKYCKTFIDHYIKNSAVIDTSKYSNNKELKFIDWYKNNPKEMTTLSRVVDPKIKDIIIDTDGKREELMFVLKDNSYITRNMLSTGTERFLNHIRYIKEIIKKNGVLLIDEIEQNLHKDLIEIIVRLFSELENKNSQLIFTTLCPELFDVMNDNGKRIFKQDSIFVINCDNDDIKVERLIDMQFSGVRIKGDVSVANLYRNRKISVHPDRENIEKFFEELKNT